MASFAALSAAAFICFCASSAVTPEKSRENSSPRSTTFPYLSTIFDRCLIWTFTSCATGGGGGFGRVASSSKSRYSFATFAAPRSVDANPAAAPAKLHRCFADIARSLAVRASLVSSSRAMISRRASAPTPMEHTSGRLSSALRPGSRGDGALRHAPLVAALGALDRGVGAPACLSKCASFVSPKPGGSPERLVTFADAGADPGTPRRPFDAPFRSSRDPTCSTHSPVKILPTRPAASSLAISLAVVRVDAASSASSSSASRGVSFVLTPRYLFAVIARRTRSSSSSLEASTPCSSASVARSFSNCASLRSSRANALTSASTSSRSRVSVASDSSTTSPRASMTTRLDVVSVSAVVSLVSSTSVSAAVSTNSPLSSKTTLRTTASEEGTPSAPRRRCGGSCGMARFALTPPGGNRRPTGHTPRLRPAIALTRSTRAMASECPSSAVAPPASTGSGRATASPACFRAIARCSSALSVSLGYHATCAPPRTPGTTCGIHALVSRSPRSSLGGGRVSARTGSFRVAPTIARRSRDSARSSAEKTPARALGATSYRSSRTKR